MARTLATRSLCTRDQVGAIVCDRDGKVIGEGYNNPAKYFEHNDRPCVEWCVRGVTRAFEQGLLEELPVWASGRFRQGPGNIGYDDCPALHAEANALITSDRSLRVGGIIYVTSHPCMTCAKLISNSGLTGVYVGHDGQHEYRRDQVVYDYLMRLGLRVWEELHEPR